MVNRERGAPSSAQLHHVGPHRRIETADAMTEVRIAPDFAALQTAMPEQSFAQLRITIQTRQRV